MAEEAAAAVREDRSRSSDNKIGDVGATAIAKALTVNESMTEVYLFGNNIGDKAKEELRKVAAARASLKISF